MKYIFGFIGIIIIIFFIFWAGIGILALIGVVSRYLSVPVIVLMFLLLIYEYSTKKKNISKIKNYVIVIAICIGLYSVSFPILNLTSSVWKCAQEDDTKENKVEENNYTNNNDEVTTEKKQFNLENEKEKENTQVNKEENIAENNKKWTKENTIKKLNESQILEDIAKFTDIGFGTNVKEHDTDNYGKTSIENPYVIELSIISTNNSKISNIESMKEIVFNIVQEIQDNKENFDYNLCLICFHFVNTDNQYGFGGENFFIGSNIINNYFKEARTDITGISGIDGSVKKIYFDSISFYQWIEDNLTYPEELSIWAENTSWTTISDKSSLLP